MSNSNKGYACEISHEKNKERKNYLIKTESQYSFDENHVLHEVVKYRLNMGKIIYNFIWLSFIVLLILFGVGLASAKGAENKAVETDKEIQETETENKLIEVIFDKCSSNYLDEEEIYELYSDKESFCDQLQFYINLMYARHGQAFERGGDSDAYFQEQEWYQQLVKKEVSYEELNEFEEKNVNLLVGILKREGYR